MKLVNHDKGQEIYHKGTPIGMIWPSGKGWLVQPYWCEMGYDTLDEGTFESVAAELHDDYVKHIKYKRVHTI